LTEEDWEFLLEWNSDSEVLYYSEGGWITSWSLPEMQRLYRNVSQRAYTFMIELEGQPIGECWLQEMNLDRVKSKYPGKDVRRIDLMIGRKDLWGKGWGTRVIGLLTRFAFEECGVDVVYEPEIGDHNPRSHRAFEKNKYRVVEVIPQEEGSKARVAYDLALMRDEYERLIWPADDR